MKIEITTTKEELALATVGASALGHTLKYAIMSIDNDESRETEAVPLESEPQQDREESGTKMLPGEPLLKMPE